MNQSQLNRTRHPCAGMTKPQREAFECIAINMSGGHHPRTIAVLLEKGLIIQEEDKVVGRDMFGPIKVPVYYVPLNYHYQWCKWCSENVPDDVEGE